MGHPSTNTTITIVLGASFIFGFLPRALAQGKPGNSFLEDTSSWQREAFNVEDERGLPLSSSLVPDNSQKKTEKLSALQLQAREARNQGVQMQRAGNLSEAMGLYLKAVQLDPFYAVAFNDLGVLNEANGLLDEAEDNYKKSITIDPSYLSPYSNLASLLEAKRDLKNAAYYWKKRAELGDPQDAWTQKAIRRLEDLRLVLKDNRPNTEEDNIVDLNKYVAIKKSILRYDDRALARNYFDKAKLCYKKGDFAVSLKYAVDAQLLDSANKEIDEFIERLQTRLLLSK